MRRRDLLPLLAALVAARPLAAGAQQPRIPVVGFLAIASPERSAAWLAQWREGLGEAGFVEGRTLAVDYRSADGDPSRFPAFAADLVARRVNAIVTTTTPAAAAAKKATTTIPIVFSGINDPVGAGLVQSLNRPGGNVTGVAGFEALADKRLQLLHELVPAATRIGYLVDHKTSSWPGELERVADAGKTLGVEVILLTATKPEEIEAALATAARTGIGGIVVQTPSALIYAQQKRMLELLARYALPAAGGFEFTAQGGLMSYTATDGVYLTGTQVGRILNGAKPAELPVMQPTKFALVINLKTAKALGLTVPPALLAAASELIE